MKMRASTGSRCRELTSRIFQLSQLVKLSPVSRGAMPRQNTAMMPIINMKITDSSRPGMNPAM